MMEKAKYDNRKRVDSFKGYFGCAAKQDVGHCKYEVEKKNEEFGEIKREVQRIREEYSRFINDVAVEREQWKSLVRVARKRMEQILINKNRAQRCKRRKFIQKLKRL